jgi:hypothetical protein
MSMSLCSLIARVVSSWSWSSWLRAPGKSEQFVMSSILMHSVLFSRTPSRSFSLYWTIIFAASETL